MIHTGIADVTEYPIPSLLTEDTRITRQTQNTGSTGCTSRTQYTDATDTMTHAHTADATIFSIRSHYTNITDATTHAMNTGCTVFLVRSLLMAGIHYATPPLLAEATDGTGHTPVEEVTSSRIRSILSGNTGISAHATSADFTPNAVPTFPADGTTNTGHT